MSLLLREVSRLTDGVLRMLNTAEPESLRAEAKPPPPQAAAAAAGAAAAAAAAVCAASAATALVTLTPLAVTALLLAAMRLQEAEPPSGMGSHTEENTERTAARCDRDAELTPREQLLTPFTEAALVRPVDTAKGTASLLFCDGSFLRTTELCMHIVLTQLLKSTQYCLCTCRPEYYT